MKSQNFHLAHHNPASKNLDGRSANNSNNSNGSYVKNKNKDKKNKNKDNKNITPLLNHQQQIRKMVKYLSFARKTGQNGCV
jgi:hypothetical protein